MKKNQKGLLAQAGFVPVIIVLVVLIGFVGVYYLGRLNPKKEVSNPTSSPVATVIDTSKPTVPTTKPTTDPMANWKTYKNNKFSFKYLNDWDVYAPQIEGNALSLYIGPQEIINEIKTLFGRGGFGGGKSLTFTISEVDNMPVYQSDEFQNVTIRKTQVGGANTTKFETNVIQDMQGFNKGDKIETNVIPLADKYVVISLLDYQYKNIYDQILSTFKFTN